MKKQALKKNVAAVKNETTAALQLIWDNLNNGQQKKLLKDEQVKELLERYGII